MNNKGFTLIEVTAVVMLMALILLLVLPNVLSVRENTNEKISNNVKQILFSDAEEYVRNKGYDIKPGNIYCIPVNTLINEGVDTCINSFARLIYFKENISPLLKSSNKVRI